VLSHTPTLSFFFYEKSYLAFSFNSVFIVRTLATSGQRQTMDTFLKEGVDLAGFASQAIAGDAHFFEDALSPAKIRNHLESNQAIKHVFLLLF
jgi:hypothetical protein